MKLYVLTAFIFILQLFDWFSTRTILSNGGVEKNPVARAGIKALGVDGYLGLKAVAVTALGYYAGLESIWLAVLVLAVYAGAMVYNARSL